MVNYSMGPGKFDNFLKFTKNLDNFIETTYSDYIIYTRNIVRLIF